METDFEKMTEVTCELTLAQVCEKNRATTDYRLNDNEYIILMLDGHSFSKMIKKRFKLPFDDYFIEFMNRTAKYLVEKIQGAKFAYVQSDEISIVCTAFETEGGTIPFNGRLCKLQSIAASMATKVFNLYLYEYCIKDPTTSLELLENKLIEFDCKVWSVPTLDDVFRHFLWRQRDCIRNSKNQTGRAYFSHNQMRNLDTYAIVEKLKEEKGVDWNELDEGKKYGRFIKREMKKLINTDGVEFERNVWVVKEGSVFQYDTFKEITQIPEINDFKKVEK